MRGLLPCWDVPPPRFGSFFSSFHILGMGLRRIQTDVVAEEYIQKIPFDTSTVLKHSFWMFFHDSKRFVLFTFFR